MRYVAAYLLAALSGKESPSTKDLTVILESVGVEIDKDLLNKVINELSGKSLEDVIAKGQTMLSSVPTGGVAVASGGGGSGGGESPAEVKEEKKEEEPEEESDEDMGFGLFD